MTWKPRPVAGPPSAWIEIAASACARFPIAARSVMQGPQPAFDVRVSTTLAPAARSRRATRFATSKVYAGSAYPSAVAVPVVSHAFHSVPAFTSLLISAGCAQSRPLWPGSTAIVAPARGDRAAGALAATSVETASARRAMRATPSGYEPVGFERP